MFIVNIKSLKLYIEMENSFKNFEILFFIYILKFIDIIYF